MKKWLARNYIFYCFVGIASVSGEIIGDFLKVILDTVFRLQVLGMEEGHLVTLFRAYRLPGYPFLYNLTFCYFHKYILSTLILISWNAWVNIFYEHTLHVVQRSAIAMNFYCIRTSLQQIQSLLSYKYNAHGSSYLLYKC